MTLTATPISTAARDALLAAIKTDASGLIPAIASSMTRARC